MTRGVSFPHPSLVIPAQAGIQIQLDPQSEALRFRLRMTGGDGSRIKCGMTKRNVDPQSEALRFRLRTAKGVSFPYLPFVIPVKTGIQIQLDPQSEALCFRLRTARGWNNILCKWRYLVIFVGYGISTQLAIIINQNAQKQIWN